VEFLRLEAECFEMDFTPNSLYFWRPVIDYCWAFKAVVKGKIVAGAIAMPTRDGRIYLNSLFVSPAFRRRRIANQAAAESAAPEAGLRVRPGYVSPQGALAEVLRKAWVQGRQEGQELLP
jgi:hypothetical protein